MKRIALMVLAGVLALSAVEWETVQITDEIEADCYSPILAMDADGNLRVLYTQWGENVFLKLASNATGSWTIKDVAQVSEDFWEAYGLDVDADGNSFVAYMDWMNEHSDLFLAADTGGNFVSVNITEDENTQVVPMLKLDHEGIPHLLYVVLVTEEIGELYYGWVGADGFHSEQLTENMFPEYFLGYDLVFDPLHIPHAFYIGDDDHLWHATPGEPAWIGERLNELSSEWPSAVADPLGSFHVAYDVGGSSIHYITNMSGTWQDELVSDLGDPVGGNERPSLALEIVYGSYLGIGNPHVVWMHADAEWSYDLYYAGKTTGPWAEEPITSTPQEDEWPGYGHYFSIDVEGYGHVVYDFPDDNEIWQIYYAKSKEPLISGIAERPAEINPFDLEVRGSTIRFSLPNASSIRLDLFDASGRRVTCIASGIYAAGDHAIPINSVGLPAGVYFVQGEIAGRSASAKFVFAR